MIVFRFTGCGPAEIIKKAVKLFKCFKRAISFIYHKLEVTSY